LVRGIFFVEKYVLLSIKTHEMKGIIALILNWFAILFPPKETVEPVVPPPVPDPPTPPDVESPKPPVPEPPPTPKTLLQRIDENWLAALAATLKKKITKEKANNIRLIVSECARQGVTDARQIAYILGTVAHECDFRSIKEIRAKPGTDVWKMQEKYWHTGFYGRGFSQLTWAKNYNKFSPIVGVDLVKNPEMVLKPEIGALILVYGMRRGTFVSNGLESLTRLDRYFNEITTNWIDARRIVNGTFMADRVADAAQKIFALIEA